MILARTRTVSALGVIEIFAWGSTYYLMAVLAGPIAADTGWSAGLLSAGVSVGLLVSGLAAPRVGRLIQATGGRRVLAAGMGLIHLVTILTAGGYSLAAAIAVGTLIGPAQVGARVLEMLGRGRHHPIWTMAAATSLVLMGFLGLLLGFPAAAALVAYGAGNGLWSIARGALPLALFGPGSYAQTMGRLATPMLLASAAAPTAGGLLIESLGPGGTLSVLTALASVPCVAALFLAASIWRRRTVASA